MEASNCIRIQTLDGKRNKFKIICLFFGITVFVYIITKQNGVVIVYHLSSAVIVSANSSEKKNEWGPSPWNNLWIYDVSMHMHHKYENCCLILGGIIGKIHLDHMFKVECMCMDTCRKSSVSTPIFTTWGRFLLFFPPNLQRSLSAEIFLFKRAPLISYVLIV